MDRESSVSRLARHPAARPGTAPPTRSEAAWLSTLDLPPQREVKVPPGPMPGPARDWGDVLAAVAYQLRSLAAVGQQPQGLALRTLVDGVQQCAGALDQLERVLNHEMCRTRGLESALSGARTAMAQARAELKCTLASEQDAHRRALEDGLTTLPNEVGFRGRLDQFMTQATPSGLCLAVLYLGMDDFRSVNNGHGHDVGDALLRIVAARLRSALRAGDSVARLGGDEFACLVTNVPGRYEIQQVVGKLTQALTEPVRIGSLDLQLRVSAGTALWPGDGDTADDLLRNAQRAMHQSKRQQSGHAFFDRNTPG